MTELSAGRNVATAARIYDFLLGGVHNFPADRQTAQQAMAQLPDIAIGAQANRAFLRRAVRHLVAAGVHQFLDLGSGIPTQGNVHEIAQQVVPDARVLYVDIDPVAVAESQEILGGNPYAKAIRADVRDAQGILGHPSTRGLLDFSQPIAVILAALLHFIPDGEEAYGLVEHFMGAVVPGSYLIASHVTADGLPVSQEQTEAVVDRYRQKTATTAAGRSHAEVERFFTGLELVDPGVVWVSEWRPEPGEPDPTAGDPPRSMTYGGVARK